MTVAVRPCPSCGRPALPKPSLIPPSLTLKAAMLEILRFAQEFDAESESDEHYTAIDFADWLALSCAEPENRVAGRLTLL